jgi:hypothetical protein
VFGDAASRPTTLSCDTLKGRQMQTTETQRLPRWYASVPTEFCDGYCPPPPSFCLCLSLVLSLPSSLSTSITTRAHGRPCRQGDNSSSETTHPRSISDIDTVNIFNLQTPREDRNMPPTITIPLRERRRINRAGREGYVIPDATTHAENGVYFLVRVISMAVSNASYIAS